MIDKLYSASSLNYLVQPKFLPHGAMHPWNSAASMGSLAAHNYLTVLLRWTFHQKASQVPYHPASPTSALLQGCNFQATASMASYLRSSDGSANSAI
ncbi:hypothetical protein ACP70R_043270 [Stipagrostis hirtigluma subsp. patula]